MKKTRMALPAAFLLAAFALAGSVPAGAADSKGEAPVVEGVTQAAPVESTAAVVPAGPLPAARNMRFSLTEKRAAIEGRKKMMADIAARKAAEQQPAAVKSAP